MITNRRYWFLIGLMVLVYLAGMFVTLFENDSAQFAVMAMRMVQENDFLNLFKGPEEYLDKPHMHYWLAALSFKLFGIYDWAYRIPGILATLLGGYSCFGLGKLLYNKEVGKYASLIFLSCQTIVLGAIDVRTDAVLTGSAIFAIWQLVAYIEKESLKHIVLGALGAAIAFSTKGQIALLVIGLCILCHISYTRKWHMFLNWKVLVALLVFMMAISPMLYAYYQQFDLHPKKIIRGRNERSGIFFIFWEQSFERLSGEGVGKNSSDYFFFFHTFLWVFLPWSILGLMAYWSRAKAFVKTRFTYDCSLDFLTLGGITLIFFIISFAQFKLPHYMNIMMPLFAILTASFVYELGQNTKKRVVKTLFGFQYFILGLVFIFSFLVCVFVFKFENFLGYFVLAAVLLTTAYFSVKQEVPYLRLIYISVYASVLLNGVMNLQFYPSLLNYQGGSNMAKVVETNKIAVDNIYKFTERHSWALDFYNRYPVKILPLTQLKDKKGSWVYVDSKELEILKESGVNWDKKLTVDQFRITRLQLKFLNPESREQKLNKVHLVRLN